MEYLGIIFAFGAAVAWGVVYTIDQKVLSDLSPLALLFVYYVITIIVLAPFVFTQSSVMQGIQNIKPGTMLLIVLAVIFGTVANMLILNSINILGASTASIVEITYPLFVVLIAFALYGTMPNLYVLLGGAVILAGSMIVTYFAR